MAYRSSAVEHRGGVDWKQIGGGTMMGQYGNITVHDEGSARVSGYGDNRRPAGKSKTSHGRSSKSSTPAKTSQPRREYTPPTVYHRQASEYTETKHTFEFIGAFRLGLGIGIGLILAIPIGILTAIVTMLIFGSALAGMLQGLA